MYKDANSIVHKTENCYPVEKKELFHYLWTVQQPLPNRILYYKIVYLLLLLLFFFYINVKLFNVILLILTKTFWKHEN